MQVGSWSWSCASMGILFQTVGSMPRGGKQHYPSGCIVCLYRVDSSVNTDIHCVCCRRCPGSCFSVLDRIAKASGAQHAGSDPCTDLSTDEVDLVPCIPLVARMLVKASGRLGGERYNFSGAWMREGDFGSPKEQAVAFVQLIPGAIHFVANDGMPYASHVSTNLVVSSRGWPDIHSRLPTTSVFCPVVFHGLERRARFLSLQWPVDDSFPFHESIHQCPVALCHLPFEKQLAHLSDASLCLRCYQKPSCWHI